MPINSFDKVGRRRQFDVEPWGENEHGCFSLVSGRWMPKEDEDEQYPLLGSQDLISVDPIWPGALKDDVKEEKKERY
jgi:hypothetical protein